MCFFYTAFYAYVINPIFLNCRWKVLWNCWKPILHGSWSAQAELWTGDRYMECRSNSLYFIVWCASILGRYVCFNVLVCLNGLQCWHVYTFLFLSHYFIRAKLVWALYEVPFGTYLIYVITISVPWFSASLSFCCELHVKMNSIICLKVV